VSPIYVRPVREQLEHDRLIRQLQIKYQKKFDVMINVGEERLAPVRLGANAKEFFPDLVLYEAKKLAGLIEVESAESTNNLEAMAQWVHFAKARVPFHLYVPVQAYDAAKRLADAYNAKVTEIWTYRPAMEGFDLVRMHWETPATPRAGRKTPEPVVKADPPPAKAKAQAADKPVEKAAAKPVAKPAAKTAGKPAAKPMAKAAAKPAARPAKAAKPAKSKPARTAKPGKPVNKAVAKPAAKTAKKPDRSRKAGSARKR
jgi:hypothetical protein